MGYIGRDDVDGAGRKQVFLAADRHFQLAFDDIGYLFVDVVVFGRDAAFFYIPENERAGVAVDHLPIKSWEGILYGDIVEVLHGYFYPKVARNVDKWIS